FFLVGKTRTKAALCCGFAIALRALFLGDSLLVDCFGQALAMTHPLPPPQGRGKWRCDFSRIPFVIASEQSERGNQQSENPNTVDCRETNASRNDR
ncbi:MAG: hypothetical protein K2N69_04660, partial [Helicobacter sp.]|nr:hypothetical protein [Helicobacter sp.]